MKIELELWHLMSLLMAFFAACSAAGKMLLTQTQKHLDARFTAQELGRASNHDQLSKRLEAMESTNRNDGNQWLRLERELLNLRADLPLHYVRREDYIRGQSVIEAKLDALSSKLENAQLRGIGNGGGNHAN